MGVTLLGLAASVWGTETISAMRLNEPQLVGPYEVVMQHISGREGQNYSEAFAQISIRSGGVEVATVEPAKRNYPARRMGTAKAGIATLNLGQIYVSMSDSNSDGSINMRLYWKPLVTLIWIGSVLMALGACFSLVDRRFKRTVQRRIGSKLPGTLQSAE